MTHQKHIRNFSIIAHIDHGKSTLADRFIERYAGSNIRNAQAQMLDSMEIERERGITIKAQTVRLMYTSQDGTEYILNLIDTPGHVDFSYEVSRSLAACEGALLLVDAAQGIQAQTLSTTYQAIEHNLTLIPVLNKIDLPAADIPRTAEEIENIIGLPQSDVIGVSAKTGQGVDELMEAIIRHIPAPQTDEHAPVSALIVDCWFDNFIGIITLVRIVNGRIRKGMRIHMIHTQQTYEVEQVGVFTPKTQPTDSLGPGEIGYIIANIKKLSDCKVGDTITDAQKPCSTPLPGFQKVRPMVFCSFFPEEAGTYQNLKMALEKLQLNDASLTFENEHSPGLGMGFRCGFLGLLHLEIIQERLLREYDIPLISTAPNVIYKMTLNDGSTHNVSTPTDFHDPASIKLIEEPWAEVTIMCPDEHVGSVLSLCTERRGEQENYTYTDSGRALLVYKMPLNEILFDFYDTLMSKTRGYASMDYTPDAYRPSQIAKVDILLNGETVDSLSFMCHRSHAERRGRLICTRLKDLIPRKMFKIPIQAAIGGRIIARETIPAMRKDVTAKCYGGDASRKRKLLEKQKAGKKKMQSIGEVQVPRNIFIQALRAKD